MKLMYATPDISPFVQRSQDTADFFMGMCNAYAATRRSLGRYAGWAFAILVVPIAVLIVRVILTSAESIEEKAAFDQR